MYILYSYLSFMCMAFKKLCLGSAKSILSIQGNIFIPFIILVVERWGGLQAPLIEMGGEESANFAATSSREAYAF